MLDIRSPLPYIYYENIPLPVSIPLDRGGKEGVIFMPSWRPAGHDGFITIKKRV